MGVLAAFFGLFSPGFRGVSRGPGSSAGRLWACIPSDSPGRVWWSRFCGGRVLHPRAWLGVGVPACCSTWKTSWQLRARLPRSRLPHTGVWGWAPWFPDPLSALLNFHNSNQFFGFGYNFSEFLIMRIFKGFHQNNCTERGREALTILERFVFVMNYDPFAFFILFLYMVPFSFRFFVYD